MASADKSIVTTVATNIALAVLGAGTGVLAARLLGQAGRGELAAIQTFPSLLAVLAMLGLPEALVFFAARDPSRAGRHLATAMVLVAPVCLVAMVIGYLVMPTVLAAQSPLTIEAARSYLLLVPLMAVCGLPFNPLRGQGHFGMWNLLRLAPGVAWGLILVVAAVHGTTTAPALARANLGALTIVAVIVAVVVRRRIAPPYRANRAQMPALLRFGVPGVLTTLPQTLNLRLDQLLMGAALGAEQLGLYAVAVAWSAVTRPVLNAVGVVLFPRVAAETDADTRVALVGRSSRLSVLLSILILPPMVLVTPFALTHLFGPAFRNAVPAALILTVATTVFSFASVIEDVLRGLGRPVDALKAELAGLVVGALALFLLLPRSGIEGAAVASLLGYGTIAGVALERTRRAAGLPLTDLALPRRADVTAFVTRLRALANRPRPAPNAPRQTEPADVA